MDEAGSVAVHEYFNIFHREQFSLVVINALVKQSLDYDVITEEFINENH